MYYNDKEIKITITEDNLHIQNSYQIKNRRDMKNIIEQFKDNFPNHILNTVSTYLLVCEWATHNICYQLNILKDRTKDVDLNHKKP